MSQTLTPAHVEVLAQVPLFEGLDRVALARLAACADPIDFNAGDIVCTQGDTADGLYVVLSGSFGVFATDSTTSAEAQVGVARHGDVLGELALLLEEPRTATIRAATSGELLRIEKERFVELLKTDPAIGLRIAATLGQRLRSRDQARLEDRAFAAHVVEQGVANLPTDVLPSVLEASLLPSVSRPLLEAAFGAEAASVAAALETVGAASGQIPVPVRHELSVMLARRVGPARVTQVADAMVERLHAANHLEEALALAHEHGHPVAFASVLVDAIESSRLPPERLDHWLGLVDEQAASSSPELALARAAALERRAVALSDLPMASAGGWRARGAIGLTVLLVVASAVLASSNHLLGFGLLLGGAVVMWVAEVAPASIVGLGLLAGWMLEGVATPEQVAAGFASTDWLFVLAIFGIAAAVARSGLLFRAGLLLVRRLPPGLPLQAAALLLTGLILTPLLPTSTGRATIVGSLAASVTESLRIRTRAPAAALLGLAAWVGAGPMLFTFLNGSSLCLLAWGLLPDASRARFGWVPWAVAALPLTLIVALGSLAVLLVVLRPSAPPAVTRGRVDVQLAVLGPPRPREWAMLGVLLLTLAGLIAAPVLHLDMGVVAVVGLLASVATRNFDRDAIRGLDWDYLIFYGVALSLVRLGSALGLDALIGATLGARLAALSSHPLALVMAIALVTLLVRLALGPDQAVLLLCLALIPSAPALGIDPWVVIITVLASAGVWLVPSTMPSYLAAVSASDGRAWTTAQGRAAAVAYAGVLAVGLAVSVPYWRLLGLL